MVRIINNILAKHSNNNINYAPKSALTLHCDTLSSAASSDSIGLKDAVVSSPASQYLASETANAAAEELHPAAISSNIQHSYQLQGGWTLAAGRQTSLHSHCNTRLRQASRGAQPVSRRVARPVDRSVAQLVDRLVSRPVARPVARLVVRPVARPVARLVAQPGARSVARAGARLVARPVARLVARPVARHVAR